MKKTKSKVLSIFLCLCMIFPYMSGFSMIAGAEEELPETIVFGDLELTNGTQYPDPFEGKGFTVQFAGGSNDGKYYNTGSGIRVYNDGTMTVAAISGLITEIEITYSGSYKPSSSDAVVTTGSYDADTGKWTGAASSVIFTKPNGGSVQHWRVKSVKATVTVITTTQLTSDALPSDASSKLKISDLTGFSAISETLAAAWQDAPKSGEAFLIYGGENDSIKYAYYKNGVFKNNGTSAFYVGNIKEDMSDGGLFYYTSEAQPAQAAVKTAPQPNTLTYSAEEQALASDGEAEIGTMQYQIGTSNTTAPTGEWSDSVPAKTDAGDYYLWYRAYVDDTNVSEAACITTSIAEKQVAITAASNSKTYDGTALTDSGFTNTDLAAADTHTFIVAMTQDSTITDAGTASNVIATVDGTADTTGIATKVGNYLVTTANGTLTVNPKAVTITANSKAFAYNGTAQSESGYEVVGLVGSDAVSAVVTGSITYPSESPVANEIQSYEFTSGKATNYSVTTVNGTLTMTNASVAITITAASGSWTYDGSAHTASTVSVTSGSLRTGDTLVATASGSVTNVSDTVTGNNQVVSGYKVMHGTTEVTANYAITAEAGTLTIVPKTVKFSGITAENKVYDKSTAATLNYENAQFTGKVSGDTLTITARGSFANANAGTGKTVVISNPELGGESAGNYTLASSGNQSTTSATISKKAVTVSGITAEDKTYDKTAQAVLNYDGASFDGLIQGDKLTVSAAGNFEDVNAGENKNVNITDIVLGGTSVRNYTLALEGQQATATANITPRAVTFSNVTASNKGYDGSAEASLITGYAEFDNLVEGDTLTLSGNGVFEDANAGENKKVEFTDLELGGESADNYVIDLTGSQSETTAAITKKGVFVIASDQQVTIGEKIDDSVENATLIYAVENDYLADIELTSTSTAFATKYGKITPNNAVIKNGETDVSSNYTVYYLRGNLTVNEKDYIVRISGDDRFDTAAAISQKYMESADTVVLANGMNSADALAGVPLANKLNAPLLLTDKDELNDSALEEIKRLGAENVIILGGEGAVSKDVEEALQAENLKTERLAGGTRFGTATAIAQQVNETPTDIFFVYAFDYPDALSVSSVAAIRNAPIIYLAKDGELDEDTAMYLEALGEKGCVDNAYVIGGSGVISDDMMNKAADALGLESATRISGSDRYLTCIAVNEAFADDLTGESICVATGLNFPDALAGCVFAASRKMPMVLAAGTLSEKQVNYLKGKAAENIYVLGGTGAVSDELAQQIADVSRESLH